MRRKEEKPLHESKDTRATIWSPRSCQAARRCNVQCLQAFWRTKRQSTTNTHCLTPLTICQNCAFRKSFAETPPNFMFCPLGWIGHSGLWPVWILHDCALHVWFELHWNTPNQIEQSYQAPLVLSIAATKFLGQALFPGTTLSNNPHIHMCHMGWIEPIFKQIFPFFFARIYHCLNNSYHVGFAQQGNNLLAPLQRCLHK